MLPRAPLGHIVNDLCFPPNNGFLIGCIFLLQIQINITLLRVLILLFVCLLQLKDPCPTLKVTSGKWSGNNRFMLFLWQQGKQLTFDAIFSFYKHSVPFWGGGWGGRLCRIM